jgi:hypothetical protein
MSSEQIKTQARGFRWDCRDGDNCYASQKLFPFGQLNERLPKGVAFSDLDGICEINGNFLFIEFKSGGARIGRGQQILLEQLSALNNKITCLVLEGECNPFTVEWVTPVIGGKWGERQQTSLSEFLDGIELWGRGIRPSGYTG